MTISATLLLNSWTSRIWQNEENIRRDIKMLEYTLIVLKILHILVQLFLSRTIKEFR